MALKKREYLVKNEKMQNMGPKKYFKEIFKEIKEEIKSNESKKKSDSLINSNYK